MSTSAREFKLQIAAGLKPPKLVQALTQKIGLEVLRGVVLKTPVDTGRARGGWDVTVNAQPNDDENGSLDPSGSVTIQNGTAKIVGAPAYSQIVVYNNVHYVVFLEDGTSKQAPRGMVAVTIEQLRREL